MPRPKNTSQRQAQIVEGLLEVMAERGYERASVAAVARAAGLGAGLVHYHFENKEAILLRLIERLGRDVEARLRERLAGCEQTPRARLEAWVDVHLRRDAEHDPRRVACWVGAAAEANRNPAAARAFRRALERTHSLLEELVTDALRARGQPTDEAPALAALVQAATQGYFLLACTAPDTIPRGSAAPAARRLLAGLL